MSATVAGPRPGRRNIFPASCAACALLALAVGLLTPLPLQPALIVALAAVASGLVFPRVLQWNGLVVLLALLILFVPIRRYTLSWDLPFELEPYRLLVALMVGGWIASLLCDPKVRLRRTGLERPILLFAAAALASVVVNEHRIESLGVEADVVKTLTFAASFFLVFYLIVSVVRSFDDVTLIVKVLVLGGGIIAGLAVIENRTGVNYFDQLDRVAPFLSHEVVLDDLGRGARLRAYASAQHPIALGAALVMLIPLALYLARERARWLVAAALLLVGAVATVSRTAILMLAVVALVFLWLRPRQTKRLWPLLLPLVVAIHFALPGTLGSLKNSFFPPGGLIEEQRGYVDSGRIGDLSPTLSEWSNQPILGEGYGTRISVGPRQNARVLDDQWLYTLVETGIVGGIALAWLFLSFIRRAGRAAKDDDSPAGWLLVSLTASVTAFAVGMFTFDAFFFIQVTFLLYFMLALATVLLLERRRSESL